MSRRQSHDLQENLLRPKKIYRTRSSATGSGIFEREKVVVGPKERLRIWKNLFILSVGVTLVYVSYQGALNLQSSINSEGGLGTIALSCIYVSVALSCLFLPTLIITKLTTKWTIVLMLLCYIPFMAFQLLSSFYTLLPSGILLGLAAAPMWAAQATYVTQIGQVYSVMSESEIDAVLVTFFGLFFFFWQNADTIGNCISSLGNYRNQDKYVKLAQELKDEEARTAAKRHALEAARKIEQTMEKSDGEDDDLEDDIIVDKPRKKKGKK